VAGGVRGALDHEALELDLVDLVTKARGARLLERTLPRGLALLPAAAPAAAAATAAAAAACAAALAL